MVRKILITGALALTALGFGTSTASATELPVLSDVAVFQFTGNATANVHAAGGGGGFTFSGTVGDACVGWSDPDSLEALNPLQELDTDCSGGSITSSGGFINVVCGTGIASGNATVNGLEAGETANINYVIVFVAGQGVLAVEDGTFGDDPIVGGGGHVALTTPSGNPAECLGGVAGFGISGETVAIALDPPGNP